MKISNVRRSAIGSTLVAECDGKEVFVKSSDIGNFVDRASSFTSELELEFMLETTKEKYIILSGNKVTYMTRGVEELLLTQDIFFDHIELQSKLDSSSSFSLNFSIKGEILSMMVRAFTKQAGRTLTVLHVLNLPVFDILKAQRDRTNCILCDSEMKILHVSDNLIESLALGSPIGKDLSSVGYVEVTSEGKSIIYFENVSFEFMTSYIHGEGILMMLRKTVDDIIERKIWQSFYLWNNPEETYTLAVIDISSLKLINMYRGPSYGDKCVADLLSLLRIVDTSCFVYNSKDGSVLYGTHMTGLEVRSMLDKLKTKINFEYEFRFDLATSSEINQSGIDSYSTFKVTYQTARTRVMWEKSTNKNLSLDAIKNIMFHFTPETQTHCTRIQTISLILAERFPISAKEKSELALGALLHDVGKIFIPANIVNKPGKLSNEEFDVMKNHTSLGATIFEESRTMQNVMKIIKHHHERYDGNGYPLGVSSKDLPVSVAIVTLVDSIDAMLSTRCYKEAQPITYVINELKKNRGTQFHPDVVDAFLQCYTDGMLEGLLNIENSGEVLSYAAKRKRASNQ